MLYLGWALWIVTVVVGFKLYPQWCSRCHKRLPLWWSVPDDLDGRTKFFQPHRHVFGECPK